MPGNASLLVSYKPLDNLGHRGASQPGKLPSLSFHAARQCVSLLRHRCAVNSKFPDGYTRRCPKSLPGSFAAID